MTTKEFCTAAGIARTTLYKLIKDGKLTPPKRKIESAPIPFNWKASHVAKVKKLREKKKKKT